MTSTPILERIPLLVNISRFASKKVKHLVKFSNVCQAWEETILEYGSPFQNLKTIMRYEKTQTKMNRKKREVGAGYTDSDEYRQRTFQDEEDEALTFYKVLFRAVKHCHSERWGSFVLNYLFSDENTVKQLVVDGGRPVMKKGFRIPESFRFPQIEFVNLQKSSFRFPATVDRHTIFFRGNNDLLRMRYGHKQENLLAIVTYNKDPQMFELLMQKLRDHSPSANTDDADDNHDTDPLRNFKQEDRSLFEQFLFKTASVFNHDYLHLLATAVRNNHLPTIKLWINDMIAPIDFNKLTETGQFSEYPKSLIFVAIVHAITQAIRWNRRDALEIILSCPNEEVKKFIHELCFISRRFLSPSCFAVNCPSDRVYTHFPEKSILRLLAGHGAVELMRVFLSHVPDFFSNSNFKQLVWEMRHGKNRRNAIGDVVFSDIVSEERKIETISTIATEFVLPALKRDKNFDNFDNKCQMLFNIFFGTNKTAYGHPIRLCAKKNLPKLLKFLVSTDEEGTTNDKSSSLHQLLFSKSELTGSTKIKEHRKYIMNAINFCSFTPLMMCAQQASIETFELLLGDSEISNLVDLTIRRQPNPRTRLYNQHNIFAVCLLALHKSDKHKKMFEILKNHLLKSPNKEKRETALMLIKQPIVNGENILFRLCDEWYSSEEKIQVILNLGDDDNDLIAELILAKDDFGFSTLMAFVKNHSRILESLAKTMNALLDKLEEIRGKDMVTKFINTQDKQRESTVLHLICRTYFTLFNLDSEILNAITMLISRGADRTLKMKITGDDRKVREFTPLEYAEFFMRTDRQAATRPDNKQRLEALKKVFEEATTMKY